MKRSALFFASALILCGQAVADRGNNNGRGPVDVDLGIGDVVDASVDIGGDSLVDADLDVLGDSALGDVSDAAANAVDYATRQVNSGNQSATLIGQPRQFRCSLCQCQCEHREFRYRNSDGSCHRQYCIGHVRSQHTRKPLNAIEQRIHDHSDECDDQ